MKRFNTSPCSECAKSRMSDFSNTLFCDEEKSKNFLDDVAIYEERNRGGNIIQLTVLDCQFFGVKK